MPPQSETFAADNALPSAATATTTAITQYDVPSSDNDNPSVVIPTTTPTAAPVASSTLDSAQTHAPPREKLWQRCLLLGYKWIRECCVWKRSPALLDQPIDWVKCLEACSVQFLLEVCGASGAVWGSSEVLTWRTADNTHGIWRPLALLVGLVYLGRYWWHVKHFFEHERDYKLPKAHHRRQHVGTFVQLFGTKWLLQVCGAAGAIWGSAESFTWRHEGNESEWRVTAMVVGVVFGIRWIWQALDYCLLFSVTRPTTLPTWVATGFGTLEQTLVPLILQVLGAAGAVWGFSEIVGLRTPETIYIWRPIAVGTGLVFLIRWIWQVKALCQGEKVTPQMPDLEPVGPSNTTTEEVQDLSMELSSSLEEGIVLNDLELTETAMNGGPVVLAANG